MGLQALITVAIARKLIIAIAVLVGGVVAFGAAQFLPEEYESTARVQVDSLQQNPLTGLFEPRVRVSEFLGQQAAVAGSRAVALEVIDTLIADGFMAMSDFEDEWREKTGGELVPGNDARLWAADQLLRKLEVKADALESTLSISFRSEDAAQSARIANAFSNAYMQLILAQRQRQAARNAASFNEETFALEADIERAQRALTDFREETGIVALGAQRLEAAEVELASVTLRLAEAQADLSEAQSLLRQAQESGPRDLLTLPMPESAQSGRQAQARLSGVLAQLQRLGDRFDPSYPDYIEADRERRSLETVIRQAVEDNADFAQRRVDALMQATAEKKREVVALQEKKQQYGVLEKKVEASRETYDLVATRSLQESLQSRVNFVDVLPLARAVPAENPATPPLAVILLIGLVAGGGLGAVCAVAVELIEGRVRSGEAVRHLLRAPVFGTAPAGRVHAVVRRRRVA